MANPSVSKSPRRDRAIRTQEELISALESCASRRIADLPTSKWKQRLATLQRTWGYLLVRIMTGEVCRFCLRIRAILHNPKLSYMVRLPADPTADSGSSPRGHNFALACSSHIKQLQVQYPFLGPLEAETMSLAFQSGVRWYAHKGIESCSGENHP